MRLPTPFLRPVCVWLAIVVVLLGATLSLRAQSLDYLREFPTAERVIADFGGGTPMEARARQVAALSRLYDALEEMAGQRWATGAFPNAQEKPIVDSYAREMNRLRNEGLATFAGQAPGMNTPRSRWMASIERMDQSGDFTRDVLGRYLSPATQGQYRAAVSDSDALAAEGRASINQGLKDLSGVRDGTWERMTEETRTGAITFAVLMLALLALGAVRELRPFRIDTTGTPSLRFGFGRARLEWTTGEVANYQAVDHTTTTVWERRMAGGGLSSTYTTSVTIRHEEFDLVTDDSRIHVHTQHVTFAPPGSGEFVELIGKPLSAAWLTRRWRKQRPFVLFRRAGSVDVPAVITNRAMAGLLSPRLWTILPAMGLGFVIGSSTNLLDDVLALTSPNLRGMVGLVAAIPLWAVTLLAVSVVRDRRFAANELPKLRAAIDATPQSFQPW